MSEKNQGAKERILEAGRKLFFAHGFQRVSTDMIAKEAAVSKTSLYKHFKGLLPLLNAVTRSEAKNFEPGEPLVLTDVQNLKAALTAYGTRLLSFLNDPEVLQFSQLMQEEARINKEVAATFYDAAYGNSLRFLEDCFSQGLDEGFLNSALSAGELADQLLGMWEGIPYIRAQMGVTDLPFPNPAEWSAKCVATLFEAAVNDVSSRSSPQ
ncbi:MAG: TetR/AcrR family transcriptional regulator [Acidobacteriota bacterium]